MTDGPGGDTGGGRRADDGDPTDSADDGDELATERDGGRESQRERGLTPAPVDGSTLGDRPDPSALEETLPATWAGQGQEAPEDVDPTDVQKSVLNDVKQYFREETFDEAFAAPPDEEFIENRWFDFSYLEQYEEVERRWVNRPYAYVSVLYDADDTELRYHVTEIELDEFEGYVRDDLTTILRNSLMYQDVEEDVDKAALFEDRAKTAMTDHAATVEDGSLYKLLYYLLRDFIDFGKIDPVMRDEAIEDISCDGVDVPVFVYHRTYRDMRTNIQFGRNALNSFVVRLAQRSGKNVSVSDPLVDASLPDGSRIQLTLGGEIATRGSNFTIRKFADVPYTPIDLINWNTFSLEQMAYFWLCIENNRSLVLAGGTGSGKTTSMNALSFFVPPNSKVVSIEDTREITLPHDNWIQSVSRPAVTAEGRGEVSMYQLLQASLRQRPEYLLVGEIRTEQRVAFTFFQAMATGHTAYTTIHADSVVGALARLQNAPLSVPAQMIRNLDIISIQRQIYQDDRRVRRNMEVAEILPSETGETVDTRSVFRRDPRTDKHEHVGDSHVLAEIAEQRGWTDEHLREQLAAREEVLRYMVDNGIDAYDEVTRLIHTFSKNPSFVLAMIREGEYAPERLEDVDVEEFDWYDQTAATTPGGPGGPDATGDDR